MTGEQGRSHLSVLLDEAVHALCIKPSGRYIDGTFGRGGHCRAILEQLGQGGAVLGIDRDPEAVASAASELGRDQRLTVLQGNFADMEQLAARAWPACGPSNVDGVLLDLGVSSPQLDDAARGFSFQQDGPLDMRMNPDEGMSAAAWLAQAREQDIARVIYEFGEERHSRRIARLITEARKEKALETTAELAQLVARAVPGREPGKHPATRTFQALRIFMNGELEQVQQGLVAATRLLSKGGRLVVISFHSLEDRIVKRYLRGDHVRDRTPRKLPIQGEAAAWCLRTVGRAVRPGATECQQNPRARSAVMRVAEKIGEAAA